MIAMQINQKAFYTTKKIQNTYTQLHNLFHT